MALQKDDGSCAPWLCHYCNALCMDCSAFQAHCLLHLRRPKVRGWVPSREYIWETASSTVEKNAKWQHHSRIGKVLQLLFESYWRDIEPVFYEWLERYWSEKISERYLREIGKLSLEGIGESLELFPCKSLQKHVCFVVFALVSDEKKGSKLWFFSKKYVNIMFFHKKTNVP